MAVSGPARTLARERAMQFVFAISFTNYDWEEVLDEFWDTNPSRHNVREYGNFLIRGVFKHIGAIEDNLIESLKGWTPDRVGKVEWAILQVATYEILFVEEVPGKVAINEALELAKRYAAEESPTFINGVLDRILQSTRTAKPVQS